MTRQVKFTTFQPKFRDAGLANMPDVGPPGDEPPHATRVYLSASWKQRERVRVLAVDLRAAGCQVYDFTDQAARSLVLGGEPAQEIPPEEYPDQFDPRRHVYREYIQSVPDWRRAVSQNRAALQWCDVAVLMLPAGNDAHADWAFAVGLGKRTVVVGHPVAGDRSPTHMWADSFVDHDADVADAVPNSPRRATANSVSATGAVVGRGH